jgi:hypothetical protein
VNVTDDGSGKPESEYSGGRTVYGGSDLGEIYFVTPTGAAATMLAGCSGSATLPAESDPACYPAGSQAVQSYRHSHYDNHRAGVTADAEWHTDLGAIDNTVRSGVWLEKYQRSVTRDWHRLLNVGSNIAFRKSEFIQGDGFRGNLQDTRGEYEFMVNKYARRRLTAVATERDAWIIDDAPSRHTWLTHNIYYMHTRKHLKRSLSHRFLPFLNEVGIHLTFVACLAIIAFAALTQRWVLLGVAIAALVATIILRTWIARKVIVAYDEDIAAWRVYPYELSWLWHKCYHRLRYWRANKSDFTSHKV